MTDIPASGQDVPEVQVPDKRRIPPINGWIGAGIGAGIGSAAIAAALLYASRARKKDKGW